MQEIIVLYHFLDLGNRQKTKAINMTHKPSLAAPAPSQKVRVWSA